MRRFDFGRALVVAVFLGAGLLRAALATPITLAAGPPAPVETGALDWLLGSSLNTYTPGGATRVWTITNSSLTGLEPVALDGAVGGELAVTATEAVAAVDAIGAVTACAVSVVCAAAVGAVGVAALVAARLSVDSNGNTLTFDQGVPATPGQLFMWNAANGCAPQATIQAAGACSAPNWPNLQCTIAGTNADGSQYGGCQDSLGRGFALGQSLHSAMSCPPIQGVPMAPAEDGKCPGGLPETGLIPSAAAAVLVAAGFDLGSSSMAPAAEAAIGANTPVTADVQASGPATQNGPATTTTTVDTAADGTQQTKTTVTTPTYTNTYNGNEVKQTEAGETSTTTNSDGSTSTTSTVTPPASGSTPASGASSGSGSDTSDLCALHPQALACDTLGTPDTSGPTWGTQNVTFSVEDIGMPSGCPAPRTFTVRGILFELNYQPACDVAPTVAPGLIAITSLGCLLWIIAQIRA